MPSQRHQLGPIDLGDLTPTFRSITYKRQGKQVTIKGYVEGESVPGIVRVNLRKALRRRQAILSDKDTTTDEYEEGLYEYLRDTILAVTIGLQEDEATVIAADENKYFMVMRALGWEPEPDEDEPEEATEDSPEVNGSDVSPSTGVASSPNSHSATDSATDNS